MLNINPHNTLYSHIGTISQDIGEIKQKLTHQQEGHTKKSNEEKK